MPIHVVMQTLIPYSRFSRNYKTDVQDLVARVVSVIFELCDFHFYISQTIEKQFGISWIIWSVIQIQSATELVWGHGHVH